MAEIVLILVTIVADGTIQAKEVDAFRWLRKCELASKGRMMYNKPNMNYVCIEREYDESRKDMGNN